MKILIADDEAAIRASLEMILNRSYANQETHFAVDGEEAVNKAQNNTYDIILLDLNMPKINGYEALKKIRETHARTPIIFITATGDPRKVRQSIAQHDLTAFIEKPFTPEQVIEIINQAIKSARQAR